MGRSDRTWVADHERGRVVGVSCPPKSDGGSYSNQPIWIARLTSEPQARVGELVELRTSAVRSRSTRPQGRVLKLSRDGDGPVSRRIGSGSKPGCRKRCGATHRWAAACKQTRACGPEACAQPSP